MKFVQKYFMLALALLWLGGLAYYIRRPAHDLEEWEEGPYDVADGRSDADLRSENARLLLEVDYLKRRLTAATSKRMTGKGGKGADR